MPAAGRRLLFVMLALVLGASLSRVGPAHAQNSLVFAKGVQAGTVTFGNGGGQVNAVTSTVTLGTAVDSSKAFVQCTFSTTQATPATHPTCELTDSTVVITLGITAAIASSAHTVVQWYVVELEGNVLVQRGLAVFTTSGADAGTASTEPYNGSAAGALTLTSAVDCTKSFVLTTERVNLSAGNADEQWQAAATLVTSTGGSAPRTVCTAGTTTALELFRNENTANGTPLKIAWQVVQIDGITVQRGQSCIGSTGVCGAVTAGATQGQSVNATLSAIDTAKSFVRTTQRVGTGVGGNEGDYRVRADFSSTTEARFTRGTTNTNAADQVQLTWEVVSLNDAGRVERNAFASPVAFTTSPANSGSFGTNVYQARTVPFFSASHGRSNTGDHASVMVRAGTNESNLTFTRGATTSTETIAWQAVEFYGCATDPTLCSVSASGTATATRVAWTPIYYASGSACASPSTCHALVVRSTSGTITFTPTDGTSYTVGQRATSGSCTTSNGTPANPCVVFNGSGTTTTQFLAESSLSNGTVYNYKVFVKTAATTYVTLGDSLSQVSVTPQAAGPSGGQKWTYQTSGGAAMNSPVEGYNGRIYAASADNKLVAIDTSTGAELAPPVKTFGTAQGYLTWWNPSGRTLPAIAQVVVGDGNGYVTSFDGETGKRLWTRKVHTDPTDSAVGNIQAAISAQIYEFSNQDFKDAYSASFGYAGDVIFASTRNIDSGANNANNKIYALRATDGTTLWTFDPNGSGQGGMDIVVGQPAVDYNTNQLLITTHDGPSSNQASLWIISSLDGTVVASVSNLKDIDSSITTSYDGTTFYFQSTGDAKLYAWDTAGSPPAVRIAGSNIISNIIATNNAILGSVWQDYYKYLDGQSRLYFATQDGGVWCVDDGGGAFALCPEWAQGAGNPSYVFGTDGLAADATPVSAPMLLEPNLFAGGGDNGVGHEGRGYLFQISTVDGSVYYSSPGSGLPQPFQIDSSTVLGDLSTTPEADALYLGSASGRLYRINLSGSYGTLPCSGTGC